MVTLQCHCAVPELSRQIFGVVLQLPGGARVVRIEVLERGLALSPPTEKSFKNSHSWAVVVAQLVERSLLTPDIRSLNPNIGKILSANCAFIMIDKNKEKEGGGGKGLSFKNSYALKVWQPGTCFMKVNRRAIL